MQDLCGLQGIYDLFNCKTPEFNTDSGFFKSFVTVCVIYI